MGPNGSVLMETTPNKHTTSRSVPGTAIITLDNERCCYYNLSLSTRIFYQTNIKISINLLIEKTNFLKGYKII